MFNDPNISSPERKKEILKMQLGGWLIESHCLGIPDNNNFQTCQWCGMKMKANHIADEEFPLCPNNPIILKLKEKIINIIKTQKITFPINEEYPMFWWKVAPFASAIKREISRILKTIIKRIERI